MKGWLKLTIFKKKMKDSERTNKYGCIFPTFSASRMVCTVHSCMHMVRSATAWIEHSSILCHINLHSHLLHGLQDINITIGLECITLLYIHCTRSFFVQRYEIRKWFLGIFAWWGIFDRIRVLPHPRTSLPAEKNTILMINNMFFFSKL